MAGIHLSVSEIRQRIAIACQTSGRRVDDIRLIAVTKTQEPAVLSKLSAEGIHDFGENRIDHLQVMYEVAPPESRFHAIGRLQTKQLKKITQLASALHGLCELRHVPILNLLCQDRGTPFPVFIQVNTSGEESKGGIAPAQLESFVTCVRAAGNLELVGLMTMAPELRKIDNDVERIRVCFRSLKKLAAGFDLPRLSMGMSQDFTIAIEEGATDIRIGTRLFTEM